jgi:hypothetical protein
MESLEVETVSILHVGYYYPTLEIVGVSNGFNKAMGNSHLLRHLLRLS